MFVDADVRLEQGALGGLVHALRTSGARALSGLPRLLLVRPVEQLLVPAIAPVVVGRYTPSRVHDARDPTAFLNGQVILVDVDALDAVGGWAAVQHTVLEDVALAERLKRAGYALRLADLRALASTRMYDSFSGIVEGFGKNATALLGKSAGLIGAFAFATSLLPFIALALALAPLVTADASLRAIPIASIAAIALVLAIFFVQASVRKQHDAPLWPVAVLPLAYLGVAVVLGRASLRALAGAPITWKGRSYRG